MNNGISNPLCSKNGFICSINGLAVSFIIVSMFTKGFWEFSIIIGVSKLVNG